MQYNNNNLLQSGNTYAASPVPLPDGWQMAISGKGETYYIDHNTRTTHWVIPQEVLEANAASALPQYQAGPDPQMMPMGGNMGGYRGGYGGGNPRARRGIDRTKLKTKMCMNIENGGTCSYGENCAFAHSSEELSTHPHYNAAMGQAGVPMQAQPQPM